VSQLASVNVRYRRSDCGIAIVIYVDNIPVEASRVVWPDHKVIGIKAFAANDLKWKKRPPYWPDQKTARPGRQAVRPSGPEDLRDPPGENRGSEATQLAGRLPANNWRVSDFLTRHLNEVDWDAVLGLSLTPVPWVIDKSRGGRVPPTSSRVWNVAVRVLQVPKQ